MGHLCKSIYKKIINQRKSISKLITYTYSFMQKDSSDNLNEGGL
jgi:hypothetical protein